VVFGTFGVKYVCILMWNKSFNMRLFIPMHFQGFLFFILIVCVVS